jgi:hypothetical protein
VRFAYHVHDESHNMSPEISGSLFPQLILPATAPATSYPVATRFLSRGLGSVTAARPVTPNKIENISATALYYPFDIDLCVMQHHTQPVATADNLGALY